MSKTTAPSPLSDKQYREASGGVCPYCGSENIEGGSIDIQGKTAQQEVSCLECGAEWNDVYHLAGYNDLKDEDGEPIQHKED